MSGVSGNQIINGQSVSMYTPQWYDAQRQNTVRNAQTAGAAAGAGLGSAFGELPASLKGLIGDGSGASSSFGIGGSGGSGSGGWSPFSDTGGSIAPVAKVAPVDTTAAHAAAFGQAKDEAANTARASLDALTGELASRGMGGAGYEAGQIGGTLGREANTIGAASRAEAESEAGLREREATTNYQGGIAQRGQDMNAEEARVQAQLTGRGQDLGARGQDVTMRGQNMQASQDRLAMILKSLGGFNPGMGSANLY